MNQFSNYFVHFTGLETKSTLITEYLDDVNKDLLEVDTLSSLLQMISWDLTEEFRKIEGAPCEGAKTSIDHTLTSGFMAMKMYDSVFSCGAASK